MSYCSSNDKSFSMVSVLVWCPVRVFPLFSLVNIKMSGTIKKIFFSVFRSMSTIDFRLPWLVSFFYLLWISVEKLGNVENIMRKEREKVESPLHLLFFLSYPFSGNSRENVYLCLLCNISVRAFQFFYPYHPSHPPASLTSSRANNKKYKPKVNNNVEWSFFVRVMNKYTKVDRKEDAWVIQNKSWYKKTCSVVVDVYVFCWVT